MEAAIIAVGGSWRETKVVFKWEGCSVLWDKVKGWRETKVVFKFFSFVLEKLILWLKRNKSCI